MIQNTRAPRDFAVNNTKFSHNYWNNSHIQNEAAKLLFWLKNSCFEEFMRYDLKKTNCFVVSDLHANKSILSTSYIRMLSVIVVAYFFRQLHDNSIIFRQHCAVWQLRYNFPSKTLTAFNRNKEYVSKGNRQWYINLNYYECRSKRAQENIKQKKSPGTLLCQPVRYYMVT